MSADYRILGAGLILIMLALVWAVVFGGVKMKRIGTIIIVSAVTASLWTLTAWGLSHFVALPWYVIVAIGAILGMVVTQIVLSSQRANVRHNTLAAEHDAQMAKIRAKLDRES